MTRRTLAALCLAGVAAGCSPDAGTATSLGSRVLPRDRAHPLLYVALGDSTVHGVGASGAARTYVGRLAERLQVVYPAARVENLGQSGATAAQVISAQLPRAVELRPDVVTLSVGPNDLTRGRKARDFEEDLQSILRTLEARTAAVVVVSLIPDLTVTPRYRAREEIGRRVALFNEALGRAARARGAEVVDLHGASRLEVSREPDLVGADGYHPSDRGYARWAALMWQGIEARLPR